MTDERKPKGNGPSELSLSLRAAIDLITIGFRDPDGLVRGRVIGQPQLVEEFRHTVPLGDEDRCLFALGAEATDLRAAIAGMAPPRVVSLGDGRLGQLLRRVRSDADSPMPGIPESEWRALGYTPIATHGVQGIGSLSWAAAERVLSRTNRPDLADRCRLGMLRTLQTGRLVSDLALIVVRVFRRTE